ncbi:Unknown protein sequence [Pseudomonas syringae pv. solidagae]|uniref:Uncharacterized protein n=2 Tax=Pseudomonas syringae group TaxID=136849 RepID=A0A0Q0A9A8_PSESX|nr:Unknown protein sequence [Pseudomonas syringae pv. solidagae]KZL42129.1 hypothetical protein VT47_00965 [Pseudomonas syringae pv. syringae]RMT37022.1 hypothetical protein ALP49_200020 [Pseudomonas syringae pv. solidagae]RMT40263.1 hypothetical protein ALP48_00186 [Pseudomonas syringae pv. solidagae]
MPSANHKTSELFVMDELERVFFLEIAQQQARQKDSKAFAELCSLREELQRFFEEKPDSDMEVLENGPDIVFDVVERDVDIESHVKLSGVDHMEFHCESVNCALEIFGNRIFDTGQALRLSRGFRLADFSHVNSMIEVAGWWYWITDVRVRKELKLEGSIGTISGPFRDIDRPNTEVINTVSPCPARVPIRLCGAPPFVIVDSHENAVMINASPVENSLVIVLDRDAPMPSLNALRYALASRMNSIKWDRDLAYLMEGKQPLERPREEVDLSWLLQPTEDLVWATAPKAIETMLRGLCCLANRAVSNSIRVAIEKTVKDLEAVGSEVTYEKVEYAYSVARKRCDDYHPGLLPWLTE